MARKTGFSFEQIEEDFQAYGFKLLENEYKNIHTLMEFECPNHAKYETKTSYNHLRRKKGKVCPYCNKSKLCVEDIREDFTKRGYVLLENEYKGAKHKLRYRCPKHPDKDLSISYGNFKSGKGCPHCGGNAKYTLDEAKKAFEKVGLELLEKKYVDVFTNMRCKCPYHIDREIKRSLKSILNGNSCPFCLEKGSKPTVSYVEVKKLFKSKGLILLENDFKNASQKLKYHCPKHPEKDLYKTYSELKQQTYGCPYCGNSAKLDLDFVKEEFNKKGFELLENRYINRRTLMNVKCKKHPNKKLKASYDMLLKNYACRYCNGYLDFEDIKAAFAKRDLFLMEKEYIDSSTPMKYICKKHPDKVQYKNWNNFKADKGCYYCNKSRKFTIYEVKRMFSTQGFTLKESKYINSTIPMKFTCPKHPIKNTYTTLQNFNAGLLKGYSPCQYCNGKVDYEDVVQAFDRQGYELLESEYINATHTMMYRCKRHYDKVQKKTWNAFKHGSRCMFCRIEQRKGPGSSRWKGGITNLSKYLRSLISEWREETLTKYEYKCFITEKNEQELEIHHSKPFHKIRDELLKELDMPVYKTIGEYSDDNLFKIEEKLIEQHEIYEGIPLKKELHKLFHKIYTYNVNDEDLIEFKERYINGEFANGFKKDMRTRTFKTNPWSIEEDRILLERVAYYENQNKPKKWGFQSASKILGRNWTSCKKRYYTKKNL